MQSLLVHELLLGGYFLSFLDFECFHSFVSLTHY